jgi:lipopolysaccharide/colanic/teichoic acid biosynthesis glycosyltransferase
VRLEVRPGVTGLWQIRGRNESTFDERLRMDIEYIRARSLATDARIFLLTFLSVIRRPGE